jgi:hypothetical protein
METQDVTLYTIGREGCAVVRAKCEEVRRSPRYRLVGYYDAENELFVARGGAWNSSRIGASFTKADVEQVRRELKRLGIVATFDDVDSMLHHGEYILDKRATRERADRRVALAA